MTEDEKKGFDAEKRLTEAMADIEKALNNMAAKVKAKREQIDDKGLDETVKDTAENIKVGSHAIAEQVHEDAKKLRKSVEEMLDEL